MAVRGEGFRARAVIGRSRFAGQLLKTTALSTLALALSGAAAYADDTGLWQPQIRAIVGADNNGGNAALEGFLPIKQTAESVLFLDVRAKHDFKDAFGQDVGLGVRRIVNPDLMLGGYAYFNAENYGGSQFSAVTLGAEAITPVFDAHVNVFVPIKGDTTDHSVSSTLSMVSNQLIEQISVLDHRDYAAWGIEGEVGARVPLNLPDKHSLRLDIGGYHFEDPHGNDGSVTGAKAGIEYEIGDVFGTGTSLTFTGEVRNDNRDDTQFAGSVRLNIPFNPGSGSDTTAAIGGADPVYPVSEGLRKRVNERVRGDIGVRIQSQDLTGGSTTRPAINAATNAAFGKFFFADGGAAGAGTQADPTTLDDAVTNKAGSGDYIVALGGNGNLQTGGVTLKTGQTVIGGGESVTAKLFGGGTATFNLGGSDGTIQGTNVANPVITLGAGNTLNGITITGGSDGIFGNGVSGTTLTNVTVTHTGADGISGNNLTNTTLTNVTVTDAGGNGAAFTGDSTKISASNFTATGNGLDGLHIEDDGTYNFAGTTVLSSNLDDGLDITGKGTYTFAVVNAQNNTDRGITVQGTASGGTFTTTGGAISGNGGIGVFIDPITAHVVLDSITQNGGTSGVVLDHVSGSFTVNGATTISNTTGPAIQITDSPATIRFGDINITNPGADGMSFSGVNAAVVAGNIVISGLGLGHTGLDFSGSQTTFTALSANISGSGAGSIGIDLSDTTGDASITITNGGTISGVDTGVRLGIAGSLAHSANAEFTFGGTNSSIAGVTASLDARGLNQTLGHYAFGSTTFSGDQLFDVQNVIFVGASASGTGDGSSLGNLATIGTADGISASNAIFVLVNDAGNTPIDATGGFSLSAGQTLASFGNGRTFSLGGVPVNVTGDNIHHDVVVSDPGTGAATLTNSGAGAVVTAASGGTLEDFNISGGSGAAISASGSGTLAIQGVTVSGGATGLSLDGFSGTGTFNNLDITGAGTGVSITGGTTGTLTFDAASSIAGSTGVAFNIDSSTPNLTYNGTINQTAAATAVKINAMTGGSATFGGLVTANTGAADAIVLTSNTGGKINFNGGLNIDTTSGAGFTATGGGTIGVAATTGDESILTDTGQGINLSAVTIGTGGVSFDSIKTGVTSGIAVVLNGVDGGVFSGGNVTVGGAGVYGMLIAGSSATFHFSSATVANTHFEGIYLLNGNGDVTFDTVDVTDTGRNGITIEGATNDVTIKAGSVETASTSVNSSVVVSNTATSTVDLGTLNIIGTNNVGLAISSFAGTIKMAGGTISHTGVGPAVAIGDGAATGSVSIGADITSSGATGQALIINHTAGDITISGDITASTGSSLFAIGTSQTVNSGTITLSGALTATGGGNAIVGGAASGLGVNAILNVNGPLSITNATGNGLSVSNVAGAATFGAVTVTGATGNGIDISGNAGNVTFGATTVTVGSADDTAGINFSGTNADVTFGTTKVTLGAGANQTGIDFSGSSTAAAFGVTTITGTGESSSVGIDLSSTTGNKTITFLAGSGISNVGIGVQLSSGHSTATSANANFTFGDGTSANGLQSSISVISGGYTVDTVGLDPTLGNYNFNDVFFTGNANLASAVGGVTMVSQNGGVIAMGTDGLSAAVSTISVAQADALTGTQTFAFVGTVDLSSTPFTLDSGQSITGFGNNTSITTAGTIQPVNVQGNLGATGGTVTGNEAVVTGTGDFLHLLGNNQVRNTTFDYTGASGSVFTIDQSAAGFNNAGGITIEGITVSNVAAGQTAFKVDGLNTNLSITNNNINVAGTLLDANGGTGDITLTRGNLPNGGAAGTLTGGGISIANRTGGTVDFTDHVTVGGNGVSLTNNTGSTVTFADLDVSTSGATAFSATGGGTINVTAGTLANSNGQGVALDGITADIHFTSTGATFSSGNGIDLQNVGGTADFGTGTLTNTGSGISFNVGSSTAASGGNADISYGGTIATNGTGAAVSVQGMTGGSVTLSGDLTDSNAAAGGNIVIAGNDSVAITFSGSSKVISSGATDGVNIGFPGGFPVGTPSANTNSTIDFTGGGLDITTIGGAGFEAIGGAGTPSSVTITGTGNKINSGADGLILAGTNVGAAGVTFDSISSVATALGGGVVLNNVDLAGDVDIGGLTNTGQVGVTVFGVTGTGAVNFTGTTNIDVAGYGFQFGGQVGTVNIADVAGSSLTIDGGSTGISFNGVMGGSVNIGGNGGSASIGATTSTSDWAIDVNANTGGTLNYNGSINVTQGSALAVSVADLATVNLSGTVTSTTSSTAFDFAGADGTYTISSTISHSGGAGVAVDGASDGTITFSGTSKTFSTGTNNAIYKAPSIGPSQGTGTLAFTNGGLGITTSSGAGFTASTFGAGTVSVSGTGNTITTGTGTALNLDGATVGAGGVAFDSISANGAATGISLNNVSGGTINLGVVDLKNITSRGIDISGTLGATLNATSIKVGLNAANAVGLDLNGASLGTSNITAGDFDVDGGSFAGTIGIDMAGTTGTGTIQLGDLINNNPGGQTSKIENVGYGIQFSSATNARLVFGDGAGPAESTIATTGGQVIHATDSLPTNGDYNFNDVNFSGDISNLSSISVYYVTADALGTGDGSLANPGTYANAQLSSANVIVLIDKTTGGVQQTIDLGSTSYQLHDGQVLLAFKDGDAAVDVSQLGVDASGGASAAFHFTTVQNSTIVSAPAGIDTLRPILQSNTSGSVINLATSGTGTITGGVENLIIRNLGAGGGIIANATSASSFFLRNNDISVGGRALDFATSGGATADKLLLSIDGNTLQSNGGNYAGSFSGQNINATQNSLAIRSFSNNTVLNGTGNGSGLAFASVTFDSTGAGGTVSAGTLAIGTSGARVQGNGLSLTGTSGTLDLGTVAIFNNNGTGLLVDAKGPPATTFTLNSSGGSVDTTNGTALNLDPLTVNMTLGSVTTTGGTSGIIFDGVAGTFTVTGATSITGTTGAGISAIGTNAGTFNFNTVSVDNSGVGVTGGGIGWASGTLNISGLANIDTTSGAGVSQTGGTTSFTGGLTIDTTSGDGMLIINNASTVTVTGAGNTVTTATGRIVSLQLAAIGTNGVTFDTLKATGTVSGPGIQISGVTGGTFNGGDVSIAGSSTNAITVQNNTSSTVNFNSATVSSANGYGIHIVGGVTGTVTFGTVSIDNSSAGVVLENTSGTVNINGGSVGATTNPTGAGVQVIAGAATLNMAASVTKTSAGKIVDIGGVTGGTITLSGNLSATGGFDNGIYVHGNTGGTFNFSGATKTLTTGANTAVNLATNTGAAINFTNGGLAIATTSGNGFSATGGGTVSVGTGTNANTVSTTSGIAVNMASVAVAAGGVTFGSTNTTGATTSAVVLNTVTGPGTVNLGTGALVGGTSATILVGDGAGGANTGGTAGFAYAGTITSGTGRAVDIQDRTAGAGNITLSGNINHNVGGQTGIFLADNAAGTITFSGTSKTISSTTATAVSIANTGASVIFSNGGLNIDTTSGTGLSVAGSGSVTISGGTDTIDTTTGTAFASLSGSATVTSDAVLTTSGAGRVVDIGGRTAGNVTLSGTISNTGSGALGIRVQNVTGGTVTFSGSSKALTTGANAAVTLAGNTGGAIDFTNGSLVINTTSGAGFSATGGGTVTVQGTGNKITSTTGTALNVVNTTIGGSGLTFQSISSDGATNGIVLNNTGLAAGNGGLTVTGIGTTATSGGIIQNAVQGALFTSTKNLSLSNMNFTNANSGNGTLNNIDGPTFNSAAQAAINMSSVQTASFTNLNLNGGAQVGINGQNVSNLTIANTTITGFGDAVLEGDMRFYNLTGTSSITNSTFTFAAGAGGDNLIDIRNDSGTSLTLNIAGSTFSNTRNSANGAQGLNFEAFGNASATLNISNSTFSNLKTSGVEAFARGTSILNVNITDGGTAGNGNTFDTGGTTSANTGRAIGLNSQDTAQLNFNINRNKKIYGFGGPVINVYSQDNASIQGRINNNNDIENNSTGSNYAGSPISLNINDNSTAVVQIVGNTIVNNGQDAGISATVSGDGISKFSAALDVTIQNNNITLAGRNANANSFNNAILLSGGANNSDLTTLVANLQNNVVAPATINGTTGNVALAIQNTGAAGSNVYLEGFTTDGQTTWNSRGNTPLNSYIELINVNEPAAIPPSHNGGTTKTPTNPNQ